MFTTIWGVVAVSAAGFLFIPHWTAGLFTGPLMIMLYFNLLGTMQVFGIKLNAVTYVCVVISIGLVRRRILCEIVVDGYRVEKPCK